MRGLYKDKPMKGYELRYDLNVPIPKDDELLVKSMSVAICGSDAKQIFLNIDIIKIIQLIDIVADATILFKLYLYLFIFLLFVILIYIMTSNKKHIKDNRDGVNSIIFLSD